MGTIIYGFAGIGKTTFCKKYKNTIDLEESDYRYLDLTNLASEERKGLQSKINPDFPNNYFCAIENAITKYDYVFVSYNAVEYCRNRGFDYFLIFPNLDGKKEYINRYKKRNNSKKFIKNLSKNFKYYILKESKDVYAEKICFLNKNEYIEDAFKKLGLLKDNNLLPYKNETISVIVPIYNGEKYLDRMLSSINAQTYNNLQIILVDDGSIDKTKDICQKYCKDNNNFNYVWKENGGVSSARNFGLRYVKGKYVSIIDCDDKIERDYFEKFIQQMQKQNVDLAMCGINEVSNQTNQFGLDKNIVMASRNLDFYISLFNNYWFPVLWNKMYKFSIIKNANILFDENISYDEDTLFNFKYYYFARKVALMPEKLYTYYINNNSLTAKGLENVFYNSCKTIKTRIEMPKKLFGSNNEAIFISAKKILKAVLQEASALLANGENIKNIIKLYKKRLKNKFVKQATQNITLIENNYMEYFYYTKIFKQKNVDYFCSYINSYNRAR